MLPGVEVTLAGPAETTTFTTGPDGQFRFLNLRPGTYRLTRLARRALRGSCATISPHGRPDRDAAVHDAGRQRSKRRSPSPARRRSSTPGRSGPRPTSHRTNSRRIPNSRDPWALLRTVPGIIVDRINIAGNETGQQSNYSGKGTLGRESTWTMDGVVITDMSATGAPRPTSTTTRSKRSRSRPRITTSASRRAGSG